jgi:hypothetical protein
VLRVSAVAEKAGIPTSSLVCEGFTGQASTISVGMGVPNLPVARVRGHVDVQSEEELKRNIVGATLEDVITNLTTQQTSVISSNEPAPQDVVFEGGFDDINRLFYENGWSDGLPMVPPTHERIVEFLKFTDLDPHESLGVIEPDNRRATPWTVASHRER